MNTMNNPLVSTQPNLHGNQVIDFSENSIHLLALNSIKAISPAGYVYIVHPIHCNAFKIGRTISLRERIIDLQRGKSYEMEYVAYVWSDDCQQLEQRLHFRFKKFHLSGEWFALSISEIASVQRMSI